MNIARQSVLSDEKKFCFLQYKVSWLETWVSTKSYHGLKEIS